MKAVLMKDPVVRSLISSWRHYFLTAKNSPEALRGAFP